MAAARKTVEDRLVRELREGLTRKYGSLHRRARIDVKRYNSVCVRVRIIDPDFKGTSWTERDSLVWQALDTLPDELCAEISLLLLLTPQEARTSQVNLEFENPTPSPL